MVEKIVGKINTLGEGTSDKSQETHETNYRKSGRQILGTEVAAAEVTSISTAEIDVTCAAATSVPSIRRTRSVSGDPYKVPPCAKNRFAQE